MKKSRKSKIVLLSVLGLATVSLATVGFASWVISGVTEVKDQNITATVGAVVDNTLTAAITETTNIGVNFDNVSGGGNGFTNGDTKAEDLNVEFKATITGNNLDVLSSVKFVFAPSENFLALTGSGTSDTADDYIVFPFTDASNKTITLTKGSSGYELSGHTNQSSVTTSISDKVLTLTCNFKFAWGAAFGNKNPGDSTNNTPKADLVTRLKAFKQVFPTTGTLMTITVTPVAVAA